MDADPVDLRWAFQVMLERGELIANSHEFRLKEGTRVIGDVVSFNKQGAWVVLEGDSEVTFYPYSQVDPRSLAYFEIRGSHAIFRSMDRWETPWPPKWSEPAEDLLSESQNPDNPQVSPPDGLEAAQNMPTTAQNLRDLHELHLRAKTLRDRLATGPKNLAARQANLAKRQAEVGAAREQLMRARADIKNKEVQAQSMRNKCDDLRVKLNSVKKQVEYDAIRNEIAHGNNNATKLEDEILELMSKVETQEAQLKVAEADVSRLTKEVATLATEIETKSADYQSQLAELEGAIVAAEEIIPGDTRDQYRRVIKQRGADAMAPVEDNACHGCYVTVTSQTMNELINAHSLVFCKICGRILYLSEEPQNVLKRK